MQRIASELKVELKLSADDGEDSQEDVEKGAQAKDLRGEDGKEMDSPSASTGSSCCSSDIGTAGALTLLRKFPRLLAAPAILFCLIVALCVFGLVHATNESHELEGKQARDAALKAADGLATQLSTASKAALTLVAVVKMNPHWSFLESSFPVLADELFRQSNEGNGNRSLALMELTLLPFGRVRASLGRPIQRNSTADLFAPGFVEQFNTMKVVEEQPGLHVQGPVPLTNSEALAFTFGYPIFFSDADEDESWGHPDNITHPTNCPGPPCYNPQTRRKYWGSVGSLVNAEPILAGKSVHLERLLSDNLSYKLTINGPDGTSGPSTFVTGGSNPDKVTANVTVALPGNTWSLSVYNPRQDDILTTRDGLLAMVVVIAFILSGLLLLLLLSSKKASVLLAEQLVTNKLLQEEKVSREALLGRQLDLIACLEQGTKHKSRSKLSEGHMNTLEQIATAKAAISDVARKDEDIQIQELIAEGGFGKVYKGKWRGTAVAVKIMMLPGNMSGREKREKMIVWEAAISSSLVHPNVCQTYHYRIKPVKESARERSASEVTRAGTATSAVGFSDLSNGRGRKSGITTDLASESSGPEEVHSYEVQLILEHCDRSSLRDALDAGLFVRPEGVNYTAQLDCAKEVASAMLHLHCNNVLHLDLKTHNILLASSSAEGKGIACKVSDFGLSVRMDHTKTHVSSLFQGTLTHMSPEVMLKGTCSKASDVYAFGIVLWELYTGDSPFRDVPPMLLGHSIVKDGKRPSWPPGVPKGYRDLAEACWHQNPDARPSFEVILEELHKLREELGIPTPPLRPYPVVKPPQRRRPHFQETFGSFSQPSFTMLQSRDSKDFLQETGPSTPSQAALLEHAWSQPRGNGSIPQVNRPLTPSQAALLEQACSQPRGNGSAAQAKRPSSPSQVALTEQAWSQSQGEEDVSAPQATCPLSPSQAALLEQAWMRPRGNGSAAQAKRPSSPSQAALPEQAWLQSQGEENRSAPQATAPLSPTQAALLEQAWMRPRRTGSAAQAKRPSSPPQAALPEQAWLQPHEEEIRNTPPATGSLSPTQAALLEQAWLRPRGEKNGSNPQAKGSSPPSQAVFLHPRSSSAPEAQGPPPALSDGNMLMLGVLTNCEGTISASLAREDVEEKAQSTNLDMHKKSGQGGPDHPRPGVPEGGHERSFDSGVPFPPMPGSLRASMLPAKPGQIPLGRRASPSPNNTHTIGGHPGEERQICGAEGSCEGQA